MRFFTDQFFSEAQRAKLLENSHLIEHPSIRLDEQEIRSRRQEPVFYMEWQQDHTEPAKAVLDDGMSEPATVTDLSAVVVMMLMGVFGGLLVFDVLLG